MPPCGTSEALLGSLVTASRLITTLGFGQFPPGRLLLPGASLDIPEVIQLRKLLAGKNAENARRRWLEPPFNKRTAPKTCPSARVVNPLRLLRANIDTGSH